MSLPDAPNTLREKYYSVMAGQNDADILPDIETAPSTENRYLDYLARNGGGGGGDVTKAYVDEQDAKKADKVTSATAGNFAGLDSNGNLTDSGKKAADFATADDMTDVQSVIPSTATTSNKLATASDVTGEDISSTSTTSPLTDSADARVQGITIYGQSEVVEGEIVSAGEGYAVVRLADLTWEWWNQHPNIIYAVVTDKQLGLCNMLCSAYPYSQDTSFNFQYEGAYPDKTIYCATNSTSIFIKNTDYSTKEDFVASLGDATLCYELADPTQGNIIAAKTDDGTGIDGTMAVFETALPLRGVSDTVRDKLTCTADSKQVETVCGEVDLGTLNWSYNTSNTYFYADMPTNAPEIIRGGAPFICAQYETYIGIDGLANMQGTLCNSVFTAARKVLWIKNNRYTDAETFKSAMSGVTLVYPLAEPVVTPLTDAEISAFRALRTFDGTTNVSVTDNPEFTIEYLKNTDNGEAVGKIQDDLQGQINGLAIKTLTYTGTGTTTNSITFPEKPLMVLGYTQDSDYDTFVRGIMPFFFHPSTAMLRIFWKNKSETSHASDYTYSSSYALTVNGNSISWTGSDASLVLNTNGVEFTIYYI